MKDESSGRREARTVKERSNYICSSEFVFSKHLIKKCVRKYEAASIRKSHDVSLDSLSILSNFAATHSSDPGRSL